MKKQTQKEQFNELPTDAEISKSLGVVLTICLVILVFMAWIIIY